MDRIIEFEKKHVSQCVEIFNSYVSSGEVVFKPMDSETFEKLFLSERYASLGVVKTDKSGCVLGFAFGTVLEKTAYVSYIGVKREMRNKGIGKELYFELEQRMTKSGSVEKIDCMFYNPCMLSWFIPNHEPHDHPGTPGVDMDSDAYGFFKAVGFSDYAVQHSYYMTLGDYLQSEAVRDRKEKLKKAGIEVCFYDKNKHFGFSELFDNIKNEGWRKSVMSRLDEPVVVAVKDNRVIGYTGPLSLSAEKRGLFCGIGVHTDYRSHGIGKVLFSELCLGLQDMGAEFMSLFTGENNPARFVYESTGFTLVRRFSCMRKKL